MGQSNSILSKTTDLPSIFICYSLQDKNFVQEYIFNSFVNKHRVINIDWVNPNQNSQNETKIEISDVFIFVLSNNSIHDISFSNSISYANELGKKLIAVVPDDSDSSSIQINDGLRNAYWVYFHKYASPNQFHQRLTQLVDFDSLHLKYHTIILSRALLWKRNNHQNQFLLSKSDAKTAKSWILSSALGHKPSPTPLLIAYLTYSWRIPFKNPLRHDFYSGKNLKPLTKKQVDIGASLYCCYCLKDKDKISPIFSYLHAHNRDIKIMDRSTPWMKFENYKYINHNDVFIFFCSRMSLLSETCNWEIDFAIHQHKRIVIMVLEECDIDEIRSDLISYPFFFYRPTENIQFVMKELLNKCDENLYHLKHHTIISFLSELYQAAQGTKHHLQLKDEKPARQFIYQCALGFKPSLSIDMLSFCLNRKIEELTTYYHLTLPSYLEIKSNDLANYYHYRQNMITIHNETPNNIPLPLMKLKSPSSLMGPISPQFQGENANLLSHSPSLFDFENSDNEEKYEDHLSISDQNALATSPLLENTEGFGDIDTWDEVKIDQWLEDINLSHLISIFHEKFKEEDFILSSISSDILKSWEIDEVSIDLLLSSLDTIKECQQQQTIMMEDRKSIIVEQESSQLYLRINELEKMLSNVNRQNRELMNQIDQNKEMYLCMICMNAIRAVVFSPCYHLCSCNVCCYNIKECPMCRNHIDEFLPVYIS